MTMRAVTVAFEDRKEGETPADIAVHNLRAADELLQLEWFGLAALGWFKAHPGKTHQDLESWLREQKLNTHLIAVARKQLPAGMSLVGLDGKPAQYECIFSCRRPDDAKKELLSAWPTYAANFQALAAAGHLEPENKAAAESFKAMAGVSDLQDASQAAWVQGNAKRLRLTQETAEEVLARVEADMTKQHGKAPEAVVIGMHTDGSPIFGLFVGDAMAGTGFLLSPAGAKQLVSFAQSK